uniref:AT3G61860 protein n=1 Tax=Arabidopsis thaliana TaxID=3702 RepID=C0Z2W9_ARATH|nr:AT3G61860 [Arabidopsis thaliana]
MRPVFVGNFEYETRQSDLERLFDKYGRVDRVDMKSGTFLQRNKICHLLLLPAKSFLHFHTCLYHLVPTNLH